MADDQDSYNSGEHVLGTEWLVVYGTHMMVLVALGPLPSYPQDLRHCSLLRFCNAAHFGPKTSQRGPISLRILLDAALSLCGCVCPGMPCVARFPRSSKALARSFWPFQTSSLRSRPIGAEPCTRQYLRHPTWGSSSSSSLFKMTSGRRMHC